jgi:flagellar basal-body rod protein FlgG
MLNALNASATGMMAQQKQLETVSNNLANADTVGFKRSTVAFQDLMYQTLREPGSGTSPTTMNPTGVQIGSGTQVVATQRDHADGTLRQTNRPLDLAIQGDGFFAIAKPNGETAYTRDGGFRVGPEGRVETAQGFPVQPEIIVPPGASIDVSADGTVSARVGSGEIQQLGQIQLVSFTNPAGLRAEGGNLLSATPSSGVATPQDPGVPGSGRIFSGYLEASNVNPILEMTDLIRTQRVYEMASKPISAVDQMSSVLSQIR